MPRPSRSTVSLQRDKDIIVPVLGSTGSGKSTFINCLVGSEKMKVGHRQISCTTDPYPAYIVPDPDFLNLDGYRLVLLDTPGFDDTLRDDAEILERIADWLAESHRNGALVGGVLYLYDITTKRFTDAHKQQLETLTRFCGPACMKKTVMVTTNWGSTANDEFNKRESGLKKHWSIINEEVYRFLRNQESARGIMDVLLQRADLQDPLLIQQQLVDRQMSFGETEAGKYLQSVAKKKSKWSKCVVQ